MLHIWFTFTVNDALSYDKSGISEIRVKKFFIKFMHFFILKRFRILAKTFLFLMTKFSYLYI